MSQKDATEDDRTVGMRITALRKAKGCSQSVLAEALGVTFQQVQKYEKGTNRIGASRLQEIARFYRVPVSTLYGDEDTIGEQSPILTLYSKPGAAELIRAFAAIENEELRRNVLAIVNSAARLSMGPVAGSG